MLQGLRKKSGTGKTLFKSHFGTGFSATGLLCNVGKENGLGHTVNWRCSMLSVHAVGWQPDNLCSNHAPWVGDLSSGYLLANARIPGCVPALSGLPKTMSESGGSHEGADRAHLAQWASRDVQNRQCIGLVLEDRYRLAFTVCIGVDGLMGDYR